MSDDLSPEYVRRYTPPVVRPSSELELKVEVARRAVERIEEAS